ncbi:DUF3048 domain-containing protein [Paenibacillus sp. NFR01]|uniref:DUF3048 domain-containing protein n=1 Tax=Paenibacillus sp. NFR01 TaxID=1566279 RepID=UPI0008C1F125|nr:DUF3048 domain-containing protein [Paenibacillus sp. NFR01]SEU27405.1 Protein of unknown function [Paenibacillus sp. NFR01]
MITSNPHRLSFASRLLLGVLLPALALSACGGGNAANPAPPESSAAVTAMASVTPLDPSPSPSPVASAVSPLTGLPVQGELPRPLAVMINNAPAARPQSGISEADVLYEVLAEGGITRLIGIFQSHSGVVKIGPIRSIRPYLIDLGESYKAVTVHAGGSPAAYAILQHEHKEDMDEIGKAGHYFWWDATRKAPHNLYSNDAKLREGADKLGYAQTAAVPGYSFTDPDYFLAEGAPAPKFSVQFLLKSYTVGYEYNEQTRNYERQVNGQPHLDLNDGQPVAAANVMVMGADHKVLDDVGRLQIDVELGGEAMLFQRGQVLKGRWSREPGDIIRFVKQDGKEAEMYPGVTHILIVPNTPSFASHVEMTADLATN